MDEIRKIADEFGLFVIEDNAQAFDAAGAKFKIGQLSDAVCTSFIIQKNLGCFGDGGAIWTNHQYINDTVRKLRNHGSGARDHHSFGFNSRLDDLQAGVLSAKLKHIHAWNDQRHRPCRPIRQGPGRPEDHPPPLPPAELPPRLPLYEIEVVDPSSGTPCSSTSTTPASTPRRTTRSPSTSRRFPWARTRDSSARSRTPSRMPTRASACRCSPS